jgi:hypothetical protein
VIAHSNLGTDSMLVSLLQQPGLLPDVGVVTVELLNPSGNPITITLTDLSRDYAYSIPGSWTNGDYYFVAGVDGNGNGSICDPLERCGSYPDSTRPLLFHVTRTLKLRMDILLRDPEE